MQSLVKVTHALDVLRTTTVYASILSTPCRSFATIGGIDWDEKWILRKKAGRKPSIKWLKPSRRHLWHFCNPKYDPHVPLPPKIISPYGPPSQLEQDDKKTFERLKPDRWRNKFRRRFMRWLIKRELDWRDNYFREAALQRKQEKLQAQAEAEAKRQRAWRKWKKAFFSGDMEKLRELSVRPRYVLDTDKEPTDFTEASAVKPVVELGAADG